MDQNKNLNSQSIDPKHLRGLKESIRNSNRTRLSFREEKKILKLISPATISDFGRL